MQDHWRNHVVPNRAAIKELSDAELRAKASIANVGITDMYSLREAEMAMDELANRRSCNAS